MEIVGIWETAGALEQLLLESLTDQEKSGLLLRSSDSAAPFSRGELNLLAVAPEASIPTKLTLPRCKLLLLPSGAKGLLDSGAACVISYGTSPRDSLTFSSLDSPQLSLSIQRELLSLKGGLVERQELQLQRIEGIDPMLLLACTGLLLLLGKNPEEVPAILARY